MKKQRFNKKSIMEMTDLEVDKAVKIQSTQFDRRRHLTDREVEAIKKLREDGHSYSYLGNIFGVDPRTIRAIFDEEFHIRRKQQSHYGAYVSTLPKDVVKQMLAERASYKRDLVAFGKLAAN